MLCKTRVWALAMIAVTGCTVGTPTGFSNGDHWTFPLVGPLEDGVLIVPATVRGHGPYLFAIDPDANVTALDSQVADEAKLRVGLGPKRIDETDTGQVRFYAEMVDLKIAGLTIGRRDAMVFPIGFYDTEGRHINGILGRDAIADSLVFGFDRDQGIVTLSTVKAFTPPPDAIAIHYETILGTATRVSGKPPPAILVARGSSGAGASAVLDHPDDGIQPQINESERLGNRLADVPPIPRRYAIAQIGDAKLEMHLDLGAAVSQLRTSAWDKAKLDKVQAKLRIVDEAATAREVTSVGTAPAVTLDASKGARVTFVPYIERRFATAELDGSLGLDYFRPYAVYAN